MITASLGAGESPIIGRRTAVVGRRLYVLRIEEQMPRRGPVKSECHGQNIVQCPSRYIGGLIQKSSSNRGIEDPVVC